MNLETLSARVQGLVARLLDRGTAAAQGVTRDLLSAVWSFLQHPTVLHDRVVEVEERLASVERRIVGDLKAAIEKRIVAVEEGAAAVEHRLEKDLKGAVRGRVAALEGRLSDLKARVVENLKTQLHRALLVLALGAAAGVLALVGAIYALMGAWLSLRSVLSPVSASFVLAAAFFIFSFLALAILSSVRRHPNRDAGLT